MPRKPREHIPHAFYHVILRGNNGQDIFFSEEDKQEFCHLIEQGISRFGNRVHAFCLMKNHVHFLFQPQEISLSVIMHHLSLCYTQYINDKEGRIGHLFHGRYKSIMIQSDEYLNRLLRYIHLNPIRASLVKLPEEYFWCSHRTYLGENVFPWILQETLLKSFGSEHHARELYKHFIDGSIGVKESQDFLDAIRKGEELNCEEEEVQQNDKKIQIDCSRNELIHMVAEAMELSIESMLAPGKERKSTRGRAISAYLARKCESVSLKDLAETFQRDVSTVSRQANEVEEKLPIDIELAHIINTLLTRMQNR